MKMKKIGLLLAAALLMLSSVAVGESADFSALYPDKFLPAGSVPIVTETTYQSADVNLTITSSRILYSDVYVADIYVRQVECFQRAYAKGKWGKTTADVLVTARNNDAIIAMTGDSGHYFTVGWVVGNGEVLRDTRNRKRDLGILYRDGRMVTVANENIDNDQIRADVEAENIWHIFLFGPGLMDEQGKALTDFSESNVRYTNPRSAIGYFAPGHYCFVQVDGRSAKSKLEKGKSSKGMTLNQLAELMESLGCVAAYNLDGGTSSMLAWQDKVISNPCNGGRKVGDVVLIKDLYTPEPAAAAEAAQPD